jgi:hypothetical protein
MGNGTSDGERRDDSFVERLGDRISAAPTPPGAPPARAQPVLGPADFPEEHTDLAGNEASGLFDQPPPSRPDDAFDEFEGTEMPGESTRIEESEILADQSTNMLDEGPRMPFLWVESGKDKNKEYVLQEGETGVGRGIDNDVILTDVSVSRKHLRVLRDGAQLVLRDLGSGNGTTVNGKRVHQIGLNEGDRIELGETVLVVRIPSAAGAGVPPPTPTNETALPQQAPMAPPPMIPAWPQQPVPAPISASSETPSPRDGHTATVRLPRRTLVIAAAGLAALALVLGVGVGVAILAGRPGGDTMATPLPTPIPIAAPPITGVPTTIAPVTGVPASALAPPVTGVPVIAPPVTGVAVAPPVTGVPVIAPPVTGVPVIAPPVTGVPVAVPPTTVAVATPPPSTTVAVAPPPTQAAATSAPDRGSRGSRGTRPTREAAPTGSAGTAGAQLRVTSAYNSGDFDGAAAIARDAARHASGAEQHSLEALANNIDSFAGLYPRIHAAGDAMGPVASIVPIALRLDRQIVSGGHYAREIGPRYLVAQARTQIGSAPQTACPRVREALELDSGNADAQGLARQCETAAQRLLGEAQGRERSDAAGAQRTYQQVQTMVPRSSSAYTTAAERLAGLRRARPVDEDE